MVTLKELLADSSAPDFRSWTSRLVGKFVRINTAHYAATEGWVREADGPFLLIEPYSEAYGSEARVLVQLPVASIYFGEQPKKAAIGPGIIQVTSDDIREGRFWPTGDYPIPKGSALAMLDDGTPQPVVWPSARRQPTNSPNSDIVQSRTANLPVEPPVRIELFGGKKFNPVDPVHEGRDL